MPWWDKCLNVSVSLEVCCILFPSHVPCRFPLKSKLSSWHHSASLLLQLHEVKQGDKERSRMCMTLNKGRNVCFVPRKAIILKCIIMGKIPLFHHGVTGRLSCSTRLEPLPLISTCILYLKPPYFVSVPATQHHPVPPWPFPLHITTSMGLPFMASFLA